MSTIVESYADARAGNPGEDVHVAFHVQSEGEVSESEGGSDSDTGVASTTGLLVCFKSMHADVHVIAYKHEKAFTAVLEHGASVKQ